MPYIIQTIRLPIDDRETKLQDCRELSYKLTAVMRQYLDQHPNGGWNRAIAHVLAALEGARIAFEQEVVIPYEAKVFGSRTSESRFVLAAAATSTPPTPTPTVTP